MRPPRTRQHRPKGRSAVAALAFFGVGTAFFGMLGALFGPAEMMSLAAVSLLTAFAAAFAAKRASRAAPNERTDSAEPMQTTRSSPKFLGFLAVFGVVLSLASSGGAGLPDFPVLEAKPRYVLSRGAHQTEVSRLRYLLAGVGYVCFLYGVLARVNLRAGFQLLDGDPGSGDWRAGVEPREGLTRPARRAPRGPARPS